MPTPMGALPACGVQRVLIAAGVVVTCRLKPHATGRHVDTIRGVAWDEVDR